MRCRICRFAHGFTNATPVAKCALNPVWVDVAKDHYCWQFSPTYRDNPGLQIERQYGETQYQIGKRKEAERLLKLSRERNRKLREKLQSGGAK